MGKHIKFILDTGEKILIEALEAGAEEAFARRGKHGTALRCRNTHGDALQETIASPTRPSPTATGPMSMPRTPTGGSPRRRLVADSFTTGYGTWPLD